MKKCDKNASQKLQLVSFVFIALMLCSIFAGAVSAENISLSTGWNLISVPLNLTTWELGNESLVGDPLNVTPANSITSIYRYNTTSGLFEKCDHFDGWGWWPATGSENFTKLEPGRGYWVMAKNDCNLTFIGTSPSDLNVTLNKSWNLIGWYSTEKALLGEEAVVGDPLNVTPKNSLTSIYRYNSTTGLFEKSDHFDDWGWWPATGSESFTELEPGRGYWVMTKNDCVWRHEVPSGLPPDPSTVAPPLDRSVATDLATATEFLYTGSNPIQTGVAPGTIEARRVAVLRGRVLTREWTPLSGVKISILAHSEFGSTMSRSDSMFDIAVNGGGLLTVNYQKEGYLTAQRQVDVPWQDYVWLPDVVMIPLDTPVTTIDLTAAEPIQVAQGSVVTDDDGTRQATLLFPQGTSAEMVMQNGSTQPLTNLSVRATEYTVGENGPEAMPNELPPTSGYTYCVELSADEALAAGVTDVRFDQSVYFYVEDFIGFSVGSAVPTGYYDREQGLWVASENGRVIEILNITGGMADLDIDGSGQKANATALAALNITDAERQQLAALYQPGQCLWRVPTNHFTPWDYNWPYGPPDDAEPPNQPPPRKWEPEDDPCESESSIIECQNQILGERVSLVGTPFTLNYRSDRVPGCKAAYTLKIPLSGDSLPASLARIHLEILVAGRKFRESFSPQPNLTYTFTWDGKDAYNRTLQGGQPIVVRIRYAYPGVYYSVSSDFERSFSRVRGRSGVAAAVFDMRPEYEIVIWQDWHGRIGSWDARAQGLGGWSVDVHHAYDPIGRVFFLGDGRRRSVGGIIQGISTVAGTGTAGYSGDGGLATEAQLNYPRSLALAPDGSLYIADMYNHRIRRVGPGGIITTVAGTSYAGYSGDGGLATEAQLNYPNGVTLAPDGSLYIADWYNHCIRRVGPGGIITTVAGTGYAGYSGDDGSATEAQLYAPYGVAVSPDGSLYIADKVNNRIRRVGPDGIITTVAGTGYYGYSGDGGLATEAGLRDPCGLAVAPDGSLYIADFSSHNVRRVGPDGIITTVAGTGYPGYSGDGGLATEARLLVPYDIAVAPDGSLYIADSGNFRIRRVGPDGIITTVAGKGTRGYSGDGGPANDAQLKDPCAVAVAPAYLYIADCTNFRIRQVTTSWPGFSAADIAIPSEDGSELYHFNSVGRHLRTLNALTGAVVYQFTYDEAGLLISVEDGDGSVTTIERDADGTPIAIVGPYGQRTILSLDANGYLASITNPAGEVTGFSYTDDGLLTDMTDPMGNTYHYTYDDLGLLVKAEDPAGGYSELARTETDNGYEVSRTTAMGRTDNYSVERLSTGEKRLVHTFPSGIQNKVLIGTNGSRTITYADGTVVTEVEGPDPRWGMLAPLLKNQTITTPGGLQSVVETSRTVTLTDPDDPLSLDTLTDTLTINGRIYTNIFNATMNQVTITTPEGRQIFANIDAQERVVKYQVAGLPSAVNYTYDSQGRLDTVMLGPGDDPTVDRVYDIDYNARGYVESITDPLSRTVNFTYDTAGRVRVQTFSDGRQITFIPDPNGNIESITPPGRPPHSFSYTPVNLLDVYTPPALPDVPNAATDYDYNLDRDLELLTHPDGLTIDPVYNFTTDRLERIRLPEGRDIRLDYYDGEPPGEPGTGRVHEIRVQPDNVNVTYTYDGLLLAEDIWGGVVQGTVSRVHNNDFMIQSLYINSGDFFIASFAYDNDGLLSLVGASIPTVPLDIDLTITRDPDNGLVTGTTLGSVTTNQIYNSLGELATYSAAIDRTTIFDTVYDTAEKPRDKLGRIADLTETVEGVTTTYHYEYDEAGRLTDVWKNDKHVSHYGYDDNGNRISHTNPASGTGITPDDVEYDDQDRLLQYGNKTYTYTPNGELLTKTENGQTTRYDYDVLGNLRAVTLPDGTEIKYVIDGRDRRIGKKINGLLAQGFMYYQERLNPVAELDADNDVLSVFVYASRPNVPDYLVSKKEDGVTWVAYRIISDHLGSPWLVVNVTNGQVIQRLDYDEFGNVINDTNPGFQPFGFAGGLYDQHTKLTRFGARDYDPLTGRWTAKDPILFGGGDVNLFGYILNDPISTTDPTGMMTDYNRIFHPSNPYYDPLDHIASLAWEREKLWNLVKEIGEFIFGAPHEKTWKALEKGLEFRDWLDRKWKEFWWGDDPPDICLKRA